MQLWLALAIFGLTYAVISGRNLPGLRLDRPSVVLLGSVLMVASGILTPERAYASIHLGTLGLLLGMMVLNVYLQQANFFEWAAWHVLRHARNPKRLLQLTMWVSGVLSALLVNDTVCLMLTPLVVRVWLGAGLNPLPGLLALSMGSNIGSAVTLTGNPQLMIIGQLSELPYLRYALLSLPSGVVGMWSGGWVLQQCFREALSQELTPPTTEAPPAVKRRLLWPSCVVLVGVAVGFLLNLDLAWTALAGAALLLPLGGLAPEEVLAEVDWSLLLFFSGLFIVMGGVGEAGLTAWLSLQSASLLQASGVLPLLHLSWLTLLGSQLVSNVPWVLLVGPLVAPQERAEAFWLVLGLTSTYAGNLTLLGSVANIIVLEGVKDRVKIGFWEWLRFGLPVTLMSTLLGLAVLLGVLALVEG